MPDITMCANFDCPLKNGCYRFRAIPSPLRQSYARFELEKNDCFWEINRSEHDLTPVATIKSVRAEADEGKDFRKQ